MQSLKLHPIRKIWEGIMSRSTKSLKNITINKVRDDKIKKFSSSMKKMSDLVNSGKASVYIKQK